MSTANPRRHRSRLRLSLALAATLLGHIVPGNGTETPPSAPLWPVVPWPESVDSPAAFDKASRAYLLVYMNSLEALRELPPDQLQAQLHVNSLNQQSVQAWEQDALAMALRNYQLASASCSSGDWTCANTIQAKDVAQQTGRQIDAAPTPLVAWRDSAKTFSREYLGEQLRLAAIFPAVSSEIGLFNENEWNGDSLKDKEFFLTFDDGPTAAGSHTDETMAMLNESKKSATFFVLGENLERRVHATGTGAVRALYAGRCVASHGWQHKSHATWLDWQDSVTRNKSLIASTIATSDDLPLFRPPYGQRRPDSENFFRQQSLQIALWNIDSQDWNSHVDAQSASERVLALMLIKRHGVILFHDIHTKAKTALPTVFVRVGSVVTWQDCHKLAGIPGN